MSAKRGMKALDIETDSSWEDLTADRTRWRRTLNVHLKTGEEKLVNAAEDKQTRRKERITPTDQLLPTDVAFMIETCHALVDSCRTYRRT